MPQKILQMGRGGDRGKCSGPDRETSETLETRETFETFETFSFRGSGVGRSANGAVDCALIWAGGCVPDRCENHRDLRGFSTTRRSEAWSTLCPSKISSDEGGGRASVTGGALQWGTPFPFGGPVPSAFHLKRTGVSHLLSIQKRNGISWSFWWASLSAPHPNRDGGSLSS